MINDTDQQILKLKSIANMQDSYSREQQIELVKTISQSSQGLISLLNLLISRQIKQETTISYLDSIIFKCLYNCDIKPLKKKLHEYLKEGIVELESNYNIDYRPLYISLASNDFKKANELTQAHLNQLAQIKTDDKRQWLYFTDISNLPIKDLQTIDKLWTMYSIGKFGFSIQRQIWLHNNKDWEKFWHMIGWKVNRKNLRYPSEFIWNHRAPTGHLPLFNQIRGVQVLATLFIHPAWRKDHS